MTEGLAIDIKRLLAAKPQAVGLAVPAMPVESLGMEYGNRKDPYKVLLVDRRGCKTVFAASSARQASLKSS